MSSLGAKQLSGGSLSISIYRNCPRCGDGDVSARPKAQCGGVVYGIQ